MVLFELIVWLCPFGDANSWSDFRPLYVSVRLEQRSSIYGLWFLNLDPTLEISNSRVINELSGVHTLMAFEWVLESP